MKKYLFLTLAVSMTFFSCKSSTTSSASTSTTTSAPRTLQIIKLQKDISPSASYTTVYDAGIVENYPVPSGGDSMNYVGKYEGNRERHLIKFELSAQIPAGSEIVSASLTVYSLYADGKPVFAAYKVMSAWTEADVTWTARGSSSSWTTPGGDFSSSAVSSSFDTVAVTDPTTITFTLDKTLVQSWLDNPEGNFGIILKALDESPSTSEIGVATNEAVEADYEQPIATVRPSLTIGYTLP